MSIGALMGGIGQMAGGAGAAGAAGAAASTAAAPPAFDISMFDTGMAPAGGGGQVGVDAATQVGTGNENMLQRLLAIMGRGGSSSGQKLGQKAQSDGDAMRQQLMQSAQQFAAGGVNRGGRPVMVNPNEMMSPYF